MAYNEHLAERISRIFAERGFETEEKKMMGGLCYMVNDKMCVGIIKNGLMARIAPEVYDTSLSRLGAKPMDFTGRIMKGFILVEEEGIDTDHDLAYWIDLALAFNPRANSSKKKK